jgi:hypothetical protein
MCVRVFVHLFEPYNKHNGHLTEYYNIIMYVFRLCHALHVNYYSVNGVWCVRKAFIIVCTKHSWVLYYYMRDDDDGSIVLVVLLFPPRYLHNWNGRLSCCLLNGYWNNNDTTDFGWIMKITNDLVRFYFITYYRVDHRIILFHNSIIIFLLLYVAFVLLECFYLLIFFGPLGASGPRRVTIIIRYHDRAWKGKCYSKF